MTRTSSSHWKFVQLNINYYFTTSYTTSEIETFVKNQPNLYANSRALGLPVVSRHAALNWQRAKTAALFLFGRRRATRFPWRCQWDDHFEEGRGDDAVLLRPLVQSVHPVRVHVLFQHHCVSRLNQNIPLFDLYIFAHFIRLYFIYHYSLVHFHRGC